MAEYYIDTCIWLNLFKKEGDAAKGVPYWKIAKDFIEKVETSEIAIRNLPASARSKKAISECAQEHAPPFRAAVLDTSNGLILVSAVVLKELSFKLGRKYDLVNAFFDESHYIKLIKIIPEDYSFARKLESESKYEISFYDFLHIAITKRLGTMLITRDGLLLKIANKYVSAKKPEELIS